MTRGRRTILGPTWFQRDDWLSNGVIGMHQAQTRSIHTAICSCHYGGFGIDLQGVVTVSCVIGHDKVYPATRYDAICEPYKCIE